MCETIKVDFIARQVDRDSDPSFKVMVDDSKTSLEGRLKRIVRSILAKQVPEEGVST